MTPPETATQLRDRLQREIDERRERLTAMTAEIEREELRTALTALGKAGAVLAIDCCNDQCLDGQLLTTDLKPDGYALQKLIPGFDGYHHSLHVELIGGKAYVSVRANDGILQLGVYNNVFGGVLDLTATKAYLQDCGIKLSDHPLVAKREKLLGQAAELTDTIAELSLS